MHRDRVFNSIGINGKGLKSNIVVGKSTWISPNQKLNSNSNPRHEIKKICVPKCQILIFEPLLLFVVEKHYYN
jgi:hypothetical protein